MLHLDSSRLHDLPSLVIRRITGESAKDLEALYRRLANVHLPQTGDVELVDVPPAEGVVASARAR